MTVATLLAHVGIDVPRYVTVGGEIVLEPDISGTVAPLRVEPHRFHDGRDPAPTAPSSYEAAWWNTDLIARAADEEAMRTNFPGFSLRSENGEYVWIGKINTGGRGTFAVMVVPHIDKSLPSIIPKIKNLGRPEGRRILQRLWLGLRIGLPPTPSGA